MSEPLSYGSDNNIESAKVNASASASTSKNEEDMYNIYITNLHTGVLINTLKGHTSEINHINYSRANDMLVSSSNDYTVRIWNVKTGICILYLLYIHIYTCVYVRGRVVCGVWLCACMFVFSFCVCMYKAI